MLQSKAYSIGRESNTSTKKLILYTLFFILNVKLFFFQLFYIYIDYTSKRKKNDYFIRT